MRLVAGVAVVGVLSGCQVLDLGSRGAETPNEAQATTTAPMTFQASVADGARDVRPDAVIAVGATGGDLHTVTLVDAAGAELRGERQGDRWRLADPLAPGERYSMSMSGRMPDGRTVERDVAFTTITPEVEATYRVTPDRQTVGVGMPVTVTFDSAVATPALRAAVEKRMTIRTTPATNGSWGWLSDNQLIWRPQTYWTPGTKVAVNAPLTGVQTGEGKWVTENQTASFTIRDRARISTVDLASHTMTVREDGKPVATYPISGGKATRSWETRSGTKVITEKRDFMVMDAATLGVPEDDPNYYRTEVDWALRVTDTGEFLHSAPWSVWAQGRRNVSHGCVNMAPRDAKEMFTASMVGDVIDFTGSGRRMQPGDGLSVWLFSWERWQAKSAFAQQPAEAGDAVRSAAFDRARSS